MFFGVDGYCTLMASFNFKSVLLNKQIIDHSHLSQMLVDTNSNSSSKQT